MRTILGICIFCLGCALAAFGLILMAAPSEQLHHFLPGPLTSLIDHFGEWRRLIGGILFLVAATAGIIGGNRAME